MILRRLAVIPTAVVPEDGPVGPPFGIGGAEPGAPAEFELSESDAGEWRAELLDPAAWHEILSRCGRTMRLAVALTDNHGNLLGSCHNPQPVWRLARAGTPERSPGCVFCLAPDKPCGAVAEALATGKTVYTADQAGLSHIAIPLLLGKQPLGALIAGQTFASYPQPLALQRTARRFGVSRESLWSAAVHQVPISRAALRLYADLLASVGYAFLRQLYARVLDRNLHLTSQRYRLMIEGSEDRALFTVDSRSRVTSWNAGAARLLGYAESEIKGKDFSAFFTPEDVQNGIPAHKIRQLQESGRIEEEGWRVRRDGTRFISETLAMRLGEAGEDEYGILLHDVTEARRLAEAAVEAQKLESVGVMAGGIAHDFNNLLTSILGNVGLARDELPKGNAARPLLDIAERSGLQAAALVDQLLSYVGKSQVVVTRFDLSALIGEILPLIQTSIPKTVRLELSLKPGLPWIEADARAIQQVVMNLVINGAEAIGSEGGTVHVSTGIAAPGTLEKNQPGSVFLEVRDSGCGMDDATRRRIFDPFFTTKFTGRGLGLAAVSGIVRRLTGRLDVESAPGKGSRFRMVLPGVPPPIPAQLPAPAPVKGDPRGAGTILVVDDDPAIRSLVVSILKRNGYSVLTAENGQAGVDLFRSGADTIAAVVLDLTMPVMGGEEAFRLMTEMRPDIPVIVSSGYGDKAVHDHFSSALAGVIQKPYQPAMLVEMLAAVLARRAPRAVRASDS
jgi:PAS domain S-box-containing protein